MKASVLLARLRSLLPKLLLTYIVFRLVSAARRWSRKNYHLKQIALQLPTTHSTLPKSPYKTYLLGTLRDKWIDKTSEFNNDNLIKNFLPSAIKVLEDSEVVNEPICVVWVISPFFLSNIIHLPPVYSIFVKDIEIARELLSTKNLVNLKKGRAYKVSEALIGESVLATVGAKWHKQRVIIEKGFTEKLIAKQLPMIATTADDLLNRFKHMRQQNSSLEVDVIEEMLKTTMDVLGRVAFSYDVGSLKAENTRDAPVYDIFEYILDTLIRRVRDRMNFINKELPTERNRKYAACIKKLDDLILNIISARQNENASTSKSNEPRDLLDIMLSEVDDEDNAGKLTQKEILDNMRTILFAGHDTTAAALTWSCYLLAKHPHVQHQIIKEIEIKCHGRAPMSVDQVEQLDYLNAVVLEVLRLYPSANFTRTVVNDIIIKSNEKSYHLPPGAELLFLPYVTHRQDKYFKNANEFDPERWLQHNNKENIGLQAQLAKASLQEAYMPFSLGKRNCVGRKLALLEIRMIILNLCLNYDLSLPQKQPQGFQEIPYVGLTTYPKNIHVCFTAKE